MTEVILVVIWMHLEHTILVTSKETCVACHLQQNAFQLHLRRALHQLAVCKRTHLCQPTNPLPQTLGERWSMVNWLQSWCARLPSLHNSNVPNTVAARKACVPEDAPVQKPMLSVSLHASVLGTLTNVQGLNSHLKTVTVTVTECDNVNGFYFK